MTNQAQSTVEKNASSLTADQASVLEMISPTGSKLLYIRDMAKKRGVEKSLSTIRELVDLGFVEIKKNGDNISFLERLR